MKGILVFAIKDEKGRLYEIHNKTSEEIIDDIVWDGDNPECEFEKVIVKTESKIDFYAKIKSQKL
jgi:hypothetical protein